MANIHDTLRAALDSFVEDLSKMIQQATLESVEQALAAASTIPARRAGRGRGGAAVAIVLPTPRGRGAKRTPEELEQLTKRFHSYVQKNPGQRIEQLADGMGVSTRELNLPVKKLLAGKKLSTKGQKRATTYFAK
jgi:hypothetical protein